MGEVWRARDPRLGREVAIKVLPAAFHRDPERLARFEREARALATLNHPNIAQIYELETDRGQTALVMELVEGPTLAERLEAGRLPLEECLFIAREIALALEEAHDKGIVHRDLKPQNVKITESGQVKVLDFGLAKALETPGAETLSASQLHDSPTLTAAATVQGVILGTAAYMSPEQAKGAPVDKRADIWAFGVVLYEMLTGERLFAGDSVPETLAGVLRGEIELRELPEGVPTAIRRLLRRCVERNPRNRLHDIADARIVIEDLLEGELDIVGPMPGDRPSTRPTGLGILPAAAFGILLAVLAFGLGWMLRQSPASEPPLIGEQTYVRKLTFAPGLEAEPSFSPDGNSLAFTTNDRGSLDIAILPLSGGEVRRLVDTGADEAQPAWSPDGTQIAFTAARDGGFLRSMVGLVALTPFVQAQGGDVYLVPAAGGTPTRLVARASAPAWSPDGGHVAFQSDRAGHWDIWRVPARGGEPRPLTDDEEIDFHPAWSPDGAWIVFASNIGLRLVGADGASPARLLVAGNGTLSPTWSPDGRWIYFSWSRAGNHPSLWRVPFDAGGHSDSLLRAERISLGESSDVYGVVDASGRRLAWSKVEYAPDLFELDLETNDLRQLTTTSCMEDYPHLSPDGNALLFSSTCGPEADLRILDLASGDWTPVTPPGETAEFGRWSPDGESILYVGDISGARPLMVRSRGALDARELQRGVGAAPQWSPDGSRIAIGRGNPGSATPNTIWVVSLDGDERLLLESPVGQAILFPAFSGDGKTVVFQREAEGQARQLWTVPADGGEPRPLTDTALEHSHPQTTPSRPDDILIVVDHANLALVSLTTGELTFLTDFDDSTLLVDYPSWGPDGKKIYFSQTRKIGDLFLLENREAGADGT